MTKITSFVLICLLSTTGFMGCGKQTPVEPKTTNETTYNTQTFKPTTIAFEAVLGGDPGYKPWNWYDADNTPGFNAQIRTLSNGQTARITRVNGDTWGKVHTQSITCENGFNYIRVFIPSHSESVAWKLVVQEENGLWRNWVVQNSTGQTGYIDCYFASVLSAVNSGSGVFTINLIVEGAVGTYIDIAELYVFSAINPGAPNPVYWSEQFAIGTPEEIDAHTAGWFDATNNSAFHCTIVNRPGANGRIEDPSTMGGKVVSPVIPWHDSRCQEIRLAMDTHGYGFSVWLQEQSFQYRRFQLSVTATPDYYYCDISEYNLVDYGGNPTKFSISIEDVYHPIDVDYIEIR